LGGCTYVANVTAGAHTRHSLAPLRFFPCTATDTYSAHPAIGLTASPYTYTLILQVLKKYTVPDSGGLKVHCGAKIHREILYTAPPPLAVQ
jgi:hypothetical protein